MKELSPRRAWFVQEYLVDLDAKAAARRAGYVVSARSPYPYELLRAPEVAAAVRAGMEARARRLEIEADRVVRELAAVAFSDIRRVVRWRPLPARDGAAEVTRYVVELRASRDIDAASAAAIASIWPHRHGPPTVRMHDKLPALALLGRHLGLFGPLGEKADRRPHTWGSRKTGGPRPISSRGGT